LTRFAIRIGNHFGFSDRCYIGSSSHGRRLDPGKTELGFDPGVHPRLDLLVKSEHSTAICRKAATPAQGRVDEAIPATLRHGYRPVESHGQCGMNGGPGTRHIMEHEPASIETIHISVNSHENRTLYAMPIAYLAMRGEEKPNLSL
jgi:hypothetical protein